MATPAIVEPQCTQDMPSMVQLLMLLTFESASVIEFVATATGEEVYAHPMAAPATEEAPVVRPPLSLMVLLLLQLTLASTTIM